MLSIQEKLNELAGTTGLSSQEAANVLAGTTGLSIQQALQSYTGISSGSIQEILNQYLGTTNESIQYSLNNFATNFFLGEAGAGSGSNNHIDFDGNDIVLTGEFTVSFWGYITDQEGTVGRGGICGNQLNYGAGATGGRMSWYSSHSIYFNENSASYITFAHTANFEDTFSFIELKRNAANLITIYKNGTSVGSGTLAGTFHINRVMGNPNDSSWTGYNGGMYNFKIYSRELTAGESTTNQNLGHVSTDCELWYKMNETSGTTVTDYSGNGRHGTLENHTAATFFQTVANTTNIVTNGGFNDVTLNDFGWWQETPTGDPLNYVENSTGRVRIITEVGGTTTTGIRGVGALTIGKRYRAILSIATVTSGGCYMYNGSSTLSPSYTTAGLKVWDFVAEATLCAVYRISGGAAEDVIIDNIQVFERM